MNPYSIWSTPYMIVPVKLNNDGKEEEHFAISDNNGFLCTKEELKEMMDKVASFYNIDNIDGTIIKGNKLKVLNGILDKYFSHAFNEIFKRSNDLYEIPKANFKYKKFDPDKRNWSCKCNWCNDKISSKEDDGYYTLNEHVFEISMERACSVQCAELIWKDKLKEWIHENGYQEFFSL